MVNLQRLLDAAYDEKLEDKVVSCVTEYSEH